MNNMNDKNFDLVMPAAKKLILENDIDANIMQGTGTVSYTHLTLPTICSV